MSNWNLILNRNPPSGFADSDLNSEFGCALFILFHSTTRPIAQIHSVERWEDQSTKHYKDMEASGRGLIWDTIPAPIGAMRKPMTNRSGWAIWTCNRPNKRHECHPPGAKQNGEENSTESYREMTSVLLSLRTYPIGTALCLRRFVVRSQKRNEIPGIYDSTIRRQK
jgi:hypothetical protein